MFFHGLTYLLCGNYPSKWQTMLYNIIWYNGVSEKYSYFCEGN
jgi:hypothetical protein